MCCEFLNLFHRERYKQKSAISFFLPKAIKTTIHHMLNTFLNSSTIQCRQNIFSHFHCFIIPIKYYSIVEMSIVLDDYQIIDRRNGRKKKTLPHTNMLHNGLLRSQKPLSQKINVTFILSYGSNRDFKFFCFRIHTHVHWYSLTDWLTDCLTDSLAVQTFGALILKTVCRVFFLHFHHHLCSSYSFSTLDHRHPGQLRWRGHII